LAKVMFGASFVASTASAGAKTDLVQSLGADVVVDYRRDTFEEALQGPEEKLFDAILDCTGEAKR
jgi:NADPH:quinone reductase-like Zn-dependent oxidoreductase